MAHYPTYKPGTFVVIMSSGCIGSVTETTSSPVGSQYLVRWAGPDGLVREHWFPESGIKRWRDQPIRSGAILTTPGRLDVHK
jgi:hypothetical protein